MQNRADETRERLLASAERLILERGFSGTSLDDLLRATGLTKGAFFHHFKSKAELARMVVERFAENEYRMFSDWSARADRLSDDPLERVLIFLRLFEEWLDSLAEPLAGCVFASYTDESAKFEPALMAYVRDQLARWESIHEAKFQAVLDGRPPRLPTTAKALAEHAVTLIEGGLVLANAHDDPRWIQRQPQRFRQYLELLFRAA